jgi:hypothetical protein
VDSEGEILLGLTTLSGWAHLFYGDKRRREINRFVEINFSDPCAKIVIHLETARTFQRFVER